MKSPRGVIIHSLRDDLAIREIIKQNLKYKYILIDL